MKPMPFPGTHIHDLGPSVTLQVIEQPGYIKLEYTIKRDRRLQAHKTSTP